MAPSGSNAILFDVHYDGIFMFAPLRYENGVVYELRVTKDKKYDYEGLCQFLKEKLEQRFYAMFFKLHECELDVGLKIVECDSDLEAMYEFAESYGIIQIGTNVEFEFDYGDTGASLESVDDQTGAPSATGHTGPNKGKGKMIEEERPAPARKAMGRNKGIVIEENDNPNVMDSDSSDSEVEVDEIPDYSMLYSDSESEYSDRSVDYLSEGEDELIQLRKRNSEAKRAPKIFLERLEVSNSVQLLQSHPVLGYVALAYF
ncbi:hypothetical protein Tco_1120957 [Tanacetum coccineum]|uniref:PB1 domain-containing protein n=1 Tax=Tanacetum coccineum TaxID=301880 RepID=A0ABQ5IWB8_9ASTR